MTATNYKNRQTCCNFVTFKRRTIILNKYFYRIIIFFCAMKNASSLLNHLLVLLKYTDLSVKVIIQKQKCPECTGIYHHVCRVNFRNRIFFWQFKDDSSGSEEKCRKCKLFKDAAQEYDFLYCMIV